MLAGRQSFLVTALLCLLSNCLQKGFKNLVSWRIMAVRTCLSFICHWASFCIICIPTELNSATCRRYCRSYDYFIVFVHVWLFIQAWSVGKTSAALQHQTRADLTHENYSFNIPYLHKFIPICSSRQHYFRPCLFTVLLP